MMAGPYVPEGYTMTPMGLVRGVPVEGSYVDPELAQQHWNELMSTLQSPGFYQMPEWRQIMILQELGIDPRWYDYYLHPWNYQQPMMQPQYVQQPVQQQMYYQQPQVQQPVQQQPVQQQVPLEQQTEIPDLMGDDLEVPENPEDAVQMIDALIKDLNSYSSANLDQVSTIDYGVSRFGRESIGTKTSQELVKYCIEKAMEHKPKDVNVTYNLVDSAYGNGLQELAIFVNGEKRDSFIIDPYNFGGLGMPVLYGAVVKYDAAGRVTDSIKQLIPLGYTYAVCQMIFRSVLGQPKGVTSDVYMQYMMSLFEDPATYYLVDMSKEALPDDIKNYKEFGKKIEKINEAYPFKARYRLQDYTSNDSFKLISDNYVTVTDPRVKKDIPPTNVSIEVIGDSLLITEPDNKIIELDLNQETE